MSTAGSAADAIPRWPMITATLRPDGSGSLTIDGRTQNLGANDIAAARTTVLERVTATAVTVGRPVRLLSTDPAGDWQLAVHPDGHVDALDEGAVTADAATSGLARSRRSSLPARLLALGALAVACATLTFVAVSTLGANHSPAPALVRLTPRSVTRLALTNVSRSLGLAAARLKAAETARTQAAEAALRRAAARKVRLARARRARVVARRVAARRRAAVRRRRADRPSRPTAPPTRPARARAAPITPTTHPRVAPPRAPAPSPPPSGCEFPPC